MKKPVNGIRLVAMVREIRADLIPCDGSHQALPIPDVWLIADDAPPHVMAYEYTATGTFCGDFWWESVEKAKEWAANVYSIPVNAWHNVPPDVANLHKWAVDFACKDRDTEG